MSLAIFIDLLLRRIWAFVGFVLVGLLALYFGVQTLPTMYGYTALLSPGRLGASSESLPGKAANSPSMLMDMFQQQQSNGADLEVYLYFVYGRKTGIAKHGGAFLKEIKSHAAEGSNYLELVSYAPTPEAAKKFLMQILSDLQENFKPRMTAHTHHVEMEIHQIERQMSEKQEEVARMEASLKKLGLVPQLVEQKEQFTTTLLNLGYLREGLKNSLLPINVYNHSYEVIEAIDDKPVSPNYMKIAMAGIVGIVFASLYGVLLLDAFLLGRKKLKAKKKPEEPVAPTSIAV